MTKSKLLDKTDPAIQWRDIYIERHHCDVLATSRALELAGTIGGLTLEEGLLTEGVTFMGDFTRAILITMQLSPSLKFGGIRDEHTKKFGRKIKSNGYAVELAAMKTLLDAFDLFAIMAAHSENDEFIDQPIEFTACYGSNETDTCAYFTFANKQGRRCIVYFGNDPEKHKRKIRVSIRRSAHELARMFKVLATEARAATEQLDQECSAE